MEGARVLYVYCLIVAAVWVVLVLVGQVYFSYRKVDEILECLGASRLVSYRKRFIGSDFFSKAFFVNTVVGMFVFQKLHIKDGAVTREELDRVPRRLMRELRMWGFFLMGMGGMRLLCGVWVNMRAGFDEDVWVLQWFNVNYLSNFCVQRNISNA